MRKLGKKGDNNLIWFILGIVAFVTALEKIPKFMGFFIKEYGFILLLIVSTVSVVYLLIREKSEFVKCELAQIDQMSGEEFEDYLYHYFSELGYRVEKTPKSHDYGADLVLHKKGKTTVVQAKCYSDKVGIQAVQEVYASKRMYGAKTALVVTNNYFTSSAIQLAQGNQVQLWNRDTLSRNEMVKNRKQVVEHEKNISAVHSQQ